MKHLHEDPKAEPPAIRANMLASYMLYLSGRLDAADRRSTLAFGAAVGLLSVGLADVFGSARPGGALPLFETIATRPSAILCAISGFFSFLAFWPRSFSGSFWPSEVFRNGGAFQSLYLRMETDDNQLLREFFGFQSEVARLIRIKNRMASISLMFLALSATIFAIGY